MGSFGDRLKREREMRGINLDEIAEATKIGTRSLRALEEEDFEKLPGGIFNKGFVRSYAKYLGIDEEEAVSDYLIAIGETPAKAKQPTPELVAQQRTAAAKAKSNGDVSEANNAEQGDKSSWWPGIAATIFIVALGAGVWQFYLRGRLVQAQPAAAAVTKPVPAAPVNTPATSPQPATELTAAVPPSDTILQPTKSATAQPPSEAAAKLPSAAVETNRSTAEPKTAAHDGFTLQIRARQKSWVQVTADGRIVVNEELTPAAERSIHANREIVLKTGNAGGIEVSHNGSELPSLGADNQVRTLTFTSDGLVRTP